MLAVILAGGRGRRLLPYTHVIPKPLMPIGDRPILEILLRQLRASGVSEVVLAVGYQAALLEAYCGDGSRFGLEIRYSRETEPMGTAGPLGLIEDLPDAFLVMNGDLLCNLDFAELIDTHVENAAIATVGCTLRTHQVDLGVLRVDEGRWLTGYDEKPSFEYLVSIGLYVLDRRALEWVTPGEAVDLPDLVEGMIDSGERVGTYQHQGYWLDIGNREDYETGNRMYAENPRLFLPDDGS